MEGQFGADYWYSWLLSEATNASSHLDSVYTSYMYTCMYELYLCTVAIM